MRAALTVLLALTLAACGDRAMEDYPRLVPVEEILAEPALPAHAARDPDAVAAELGQAAGALQAEAEAARDGTPVAPDLSARGEALRARAAAIRAEACREAVAAGEDAPADCPS